MEVAKARGLNPLLRQIYFVKRYDTQKRCEVWSTQISIDGLRAVSERTGIYAGQDEPEFTEKDGKLVCCKVKVYRKDWQRPAVGVAYFSEYAQSKKEGGLTKFWAEKPHVMLAKCAEALAIRKAFPEDTGGLYVAEEMGQEPAPESAPAHPPPVPVVEVLPPAPEPPKAEPLKAEKTVPPAHVLRLWKRIQGEWGQMRAAVKLKEGAETVGLTKPTSEWSAFDAQAVENALFPPTDVPF
jgi:phage recombination protein Bet